MRSFAISFFCFLWAFALVAPAVLTLMDDSGVVIAQNMHEEEQEEEGEIEFENVLDRHHSVSNERQLVLPAEQGLFLSPVTGLALPHPEIVLPPPKAC